MEKYIDQYNSAMDVIYEEINSTKIDQLDPMFYHDRKLSDADIVSFMSDLSYKVDYLKDKAKRAKSGGVPLGYDDLRDLYNALVIPVSKLQSMLLDYAIDRGRLQAGLATIINRRAPRKRDVYTYDSEEEDFF